MDAAPAPGRQVAQRRRLQCRRCDLQLHPLARSGDRLVERRPVDLLRDQRGIRHRREERRRHRQDGPPPDRGRDQQGRRPHGEAEAVQAGAVGAGGSLQLPDRHRAPQLQAAVLRQSDRHRPLHARRLRGRREVHPQEGRRRILGRQGVSRRDPLLPLRRREPAAGLCLRHRRRDLRVRRRADAAGPVARRHDHRRPHGADDLLPLPRRHRAVRRQAGAPGDRQGRRQWSAEVAGVPGGR